MKYKDQSPAEKAALKKELGSAKTVAQMLSIVSDKYDLNGVKVGIMTGAVFTDQLTKVLEYFNPEKK